MSETVFNRKKISWLTPSLKTVSLNGTFAQKQFRLMVLMVKNTGEKLFITWQL